MSAIRPVTQDDEVARAAERGRPPSPTRSNPVPLALAALWVATATILQLFRSPDQAPWRAVWAEDGHVFLSHALDGRGGLFEPYSGYLQFAARAAGALAALLPLEFAAVTFAVAGSLAAALLSVYVYWASSSVFRTRWARAILAMTSVFASVTAFEVQANGLDIHWYLLFACFFAFWATSESTPALIAHSSVVAIATLSGPLTLLYTPLALRQVLVEKGRRRWVIPAVFAFSIAAQAIAVLSTPSGKQRFTPFAAVDVPLGYALRVTGSVLVSDRFVDEGWLRLGWWFALGSLVVVGAVCLFGIIRSGGPRRAFMVAALLSSGALFAVSLFLRGSGEMRPPADSFTFNGSRYTVVPVLLVIAVLLLIADGGPALGPAWLRRGLAAFVVAVTLVSFRTVPTVRAFAPNWRATLEAAREQCDDTGAERVRVPVAPGPPDAWYVGLPCDR